MTAGVPRQPFQSQGYHGSWSAPPAQPGPYGQGAPYGWPMAPQTSSNGLAIASMVLGIMWIYWIGSLLAVVFGHVSLHQLKRNPYQTGRGMAIAGLVLGYVGLALLAVVVVAMIAVGSGTGPGVDDVGGVRYSSSG